MVKMLIKHTYVTYQGKEIQLSTIANVLLDIWDDVFPGLTRPEDLLGSIPCTTSCTDLVARLSPWLFNDPSS